jgi:hypothetical protein
MGKKRVTRGKVTEVKDRPGESTVPVMKQIIPAPDGSTQVAVSIKFDDVPVPDRRYVADQGTIIFDGTVVRIAFGQKRLVSDELRSLVVVSISPDPLGRFLESCQTFLPDLEKFIVNNQIVKPDLIKLKKEPEQTVAVASNIITAARSGREATIDFYHTSAISAHAMSTRDRLAIDSILRVDLSIGLLASILDNLVELRDQLPGEAK